VPAIQNVERRGAVYYWRRTVRFQDGKPFTLRLSLRTTAQAVARSMGCAMTAKSETLKMTLGQHGRAASLTIAQKAGIFREAMEGMRDHLERVHVGYQRTDPDATFMIEGLVGIYEVMLRDFVVNGVPENVGSREHVEARFSGLTDEQKETLIDFFADRPDWRERSHDKAAQDLRTVGVAETEDNLDIARKVNLEGRLAAALEYRRRLVDPATMWAAMTDDRGPAAAMPFAAVAAAPVAVRAPVSPREPEVAEPWASMTPTQAAERFIADNPKIVGDARRKARWTEKTRTQFLSAARLLEKSYGARSIRLVVREDVVRLNEHFSRLPVSHHKSRRHDAMSLEEICREAEAEIKAGTRDAKTIGLQSTSTNRHFLFLKELMAWVGKQVDGVATIDWSDFLYEDDRDARDQRDAYTEEEGRQLFRLPIWTGSRSGVGSSRGPKFGTTRVFGCCPSLGTPAAGARRSAR